MDKKFTLRIQPKKNESLSSFLLRVCEKNKINIKDLLKYSNCRYNNFNLRLAHHLDVNPSRVINLTCLSDWTEIEENNLIQLTLKPTIKKFHLNENSLEVTNSSTLLFGFVNVSFRKFCKECLKTSVHYKLFWQLNDIDICNEHLCPLSSCCDVCGKQQPYLHEKLIYAKCFFCNSCLISSNLDKNKSDDILIKKNIWYYKQLYFLNQLNWSSTMQITSLEFFYLKILFLCGNMKFYFDTNDINFISRDYKYKLINNLKYSLNKTSFDINLTTLLNVLWNCEVEVDSLLNLKVPLEFMTSMKNYLETTNVCMTTWCSNFNTKDKLYKIKNRSKTHINIHICLGCCVKYGNNKYSKVWEEYGDLNKIAFNEIRPLVNSGWSVLEISIKTGISRYKVNKMISYLTKFNLINEDSMKNFTPKNACSFDYSYLLNVKNSKENEIIALGKNYYRLSQREMYYFYFDPIVQSSVFRE